MISVSPSSLSSLRQYMVTLKTGGHLAKKYVHVADWSMMPSRKGKRRRAQSIIHNAANEGGGDKERNDNKQTRPI